MNDSTKGLISSERVGSAILSRVAPRRGYCLGSTSPPEFSAAPAGARDRDRSRRHARPGRPAATVLVLGLLLLGAAAAEAQTERILVSNTGVADDDNANTSGNDHAQLFHTGAHADGYTLTRVLVNSEDTEGDDFDVEICEEDGSADEFPSSTCTALTAPSSFTAGFVQFTGNLLLSANTKYVVVIKQRGTGSVRLKSTTNTGEDTSLGLSDWSIKNKFYWKSGSTWMIKSGTNEALRIVVRGYAVVLSTDATLSALSVSGATLSPAFAAATTTYSAPVENAVTQVTITETTSEPTATVEYLDGSDTTRTDADTMTAGLQVNLSVGTNPVKVKVTAPDTTTTETYTVNVFRVALPVECSAASRVNRIWTGNMIVGGSGDTRGFTSQRGYLDRTTFNFQGTTYTVNTLATESSGQFLSFGLDSFFPNAGDVVLHINDDQYPLDDATEQASAYIFSTNVPTWADGDATCLALTVDGPDVSSVALTSDPGSDNTYGIGEDIEATVTFSAAVDITAAPQLELDFDGSAKAASCATGTNTTTMACEYEVVAGDSAPNGIAIGANKLTGGTTTSADLTHVAVAIDVGHKVDGIRPTLVTTGSEAPKTSTDGTKVILTFSEDIGGVSRSDITIQANSVTAATSAASVTGTKVELTLTTALTTTSTNLTVELAADAVKDDAGNGILAVAATAVTNAVGTTVSNTAPTFANPTETRSVAENSAVGTNVGAPVTATDTDSGDMLAYTLEGTDADSFTIVSTSGQIRTRAGVTYDYETTPSYTVTVKADDNNGGTDTVTVTIDLTDDVDERPLAPAAPTVTATPNTTDSLTVSWSAPSNTGRPAIESYDLQYREGTTGTWTNGPQGVSGTSATIAGLTAARTAYQVQVRATNGDGAGDWSPPGRIRTTPPPPEPAVGPPSPPRDLTAMAGDQAVQLSWRRPAEDGGAQIVRYEYRQQEGDGPVGAWQIIGEDPPPTDHQVTGLMNGVSYTFQVRAVNSREASPPSEPARATPEPELEPFEVAIVGVPDVAVAGESYELTAQSDEASLVYAWRVAWGGTIEPDDAQMVVWTAPETAVVAWIRVDATREDGAMAGQSVYVRVEVPEPEPEPEPEPVPALPLLGQLLLALGLTGAGARLLSRRPRVPPAA